jgi:hypothetical protein
MRNLCDIPKLQPEQLSGRIVVTLPSDCRADHWLRVLGTEGQALGRARTVIGSRRACRIQWFGTSAEKLTYGREIAAGRLALDFDSQAGTLTIVAPLTPEQYLAHAHSELQRVMADCRLPTRASAGQ